MPTRNKVHRHKLKKIMTIIKQARRIGERDPRSSARLGVLDNLAERSSAKLSARLASLRDARHAKSYAFCMIGTTLLAHSRSQELISLLIRLSFAQLIIYKYIIYYGLNRYRFRNNKLMHHKLVYQLLKKIKY